MGFTAKLSGPIVESSSTAIESRGFTVEKSSARFLLKGELTVCESPLPRTHLTHLRLPLLWPVVFRRLAMDRDRQH
jgi:hypothetical protein